MDTADIGTHLIHTIGRHTNKDFIPGWFTKGPDQQVNSLVTLERTRVGDDRARVGQTGLQVVAGRRVPAIVGEMDSTTVVLPGYRARVDAVGNLLIEPAA